MSNATSGIVIGSADIYSGRGAALSGVGSNKLLQNGLIGSFFNLQNGLNGNYRIAGSTVDGGNPVKRKVFLLAQPGMVLLRSTTTELPSCLFEFTGLAAGLYLVLGFDPDGVQNAVTYSFVNAVL